ncbi:MAG: hypothetical protein E6Q97_13335 [Desulfurellales bacterium]|nr:MAG: hypothetical protein E6Q97_13335 [Desulfurellales bacterium]
MSQTMSGVVVNPNVLTSIVSGLFGQSLDGPLDADRLINIPAFNPRPLVNNTYQMLTDESWKGLDFQTAPTQLEEISAASPVNIPLNLKFGSVDGRVKRYQVAKMLIPDDERSLYGANDIDISNEVGKRVVAKAKAMLAYLVSQTLSTSSNFTYNASLAEITQSYAFLQNVIYTPAKTMTRAQRWAKGVPLGTYVSTALVPKIMANNDVRAAIPLGGAGNEFKLSIPNDAALGALFKNYMASDAQEIVSSYLATDGTPTDMLSGVIAHVRTGSPEDSFMQWIVPQTRNSGSNPADGMINIWSARSDQDGVRGEVFFADIVTSLAVSAPGNGYLCYNLS